MIGSNQMLKSGQTIWLCVNCNKKKIILSKRLSKIQKFKTRPFRNWAPLNRLTKTWNNLRKELARKKMIQILRTRKIKRYKLNSLCCWRKPLKSQKMKLDLEFLQASITHQSCRPLVNLMRSPGERRILKIYRPPDINVKKEEGKWLWSRVRNIN